MAGTVRQATWPTCARRRAARRDARLAARRCAPPTCCSCRRRRAWTTSPTCSGPGSRSRATWPRTARWRSAGTAASPGPTSCRWRTPSRRASRCRGPSSTPSRPRSSARTRRSPASTTATASPVLPRRPAVAGGGPRPRPARRDGPPGRRRRPDRRPGGGRTLVQPDPHRAVDHVVHSPFWVEPGTLLGVVTREVPTARLAARGRAWQGPAESAYTGALILSDLATEAVDPTGTLARHANRGQVDSRRSAPGPGRRATRSSPRSVRAATTAPSRSSCTSPTRTSPPRTTRTGPAGRSSATRCGGSAPSPTPSSGSGGCPTSGTSPSVPGSPRGGSVTRAVVEATSGDRHRRGRLLAGPLPPLTPTSGSTCTPVKRR